MIDLDFFRSYIPVVGIFRNHAYDEAFTVVISTFVAFIVFGYVRWILEALVNGVSLPSVRKPLQCHFCESSNADAIVDPETDLCRSCGQLNAFEDDGDYSRPLPELYHAQMNLRPRCETPNSKRMGLPTTGSPKPATAPGNVLCARCIDNQEKIVVMKGNFAPFGRGDAAFAREFAQFERQLEKDYPLCQACQVRVRQFVGEQDRQIAATVASTTPAGTQHRLFMAKRSNSVNDGDVFVPSQRVYRRNRVIAMLTLLSTFIPVLVGAFDLSKFWTLRIFVNFLALGLGVVSSISSPYRRWPLTPLAILGLALAVFLDWVAVFYKLKFVSAENLSHLKFVARFTSSIIQAFPVAVTVSAFINAVSLMPYGKKESSGAFHRQNSTTTYNGSPAASEPYVTSLLAETVAHTRRQAGMSNPWKAFSSTKSVYMQSNYSPFSNGSASPRVSRCRPISSNLVVHFSIATVALVALVAYVFFVL